MKKLLIFLVVAVAQGLSSCNFSANGEDAGRVQHDWNTQAGERISQAEASAMMSSFRSAYPELTEGNYFDVAIYKQLIALPGGSVYAEILFI